MDIVSLRKVFAVVGEQFITPIIHVFIYNFSRLRLHKLGRSGFTSVYSLYYNLKLEREKMPCIEYHRPLSDFGATADSFDFYSGNQK